MGVDGRWLFHSSFCANIIMIPFNEAHSSFPRLHCSFLILTPFCSTIHLAFTPFFTFNRYGCRSFGTPSFGIDMLRLTFIFAFSALVSSVSADVYSNKFWGITSSSLKQKAPVPVKNQCSDAGSFLTKFNGSSSALQCFET